MTLQIHLVSIPHVYSCRCVIAGGHHVVPSRADFAGNILTGMVLPCLLHIQSHAKDRLPGGALPRKTSQPPGSWEILSSWCEMPARGGPGAGVGVSRCISTASEASFAPGRGATAALGNSGTRSVFLRAVWKCDGGDRVVHCTL